METDPMLEVEPGRRDRLRPLFAAHRNLRAVIEGVLDGVLGRAWCDERGEVARLQLGVYQILGGDPGGAAGTRLLGAIPAPCEVVLPPDRPAWVAAAEAAFGDRAQRRTMTVFTPDQVTAERQQACLASVPDGVNVTGIEPAHLVDFDDELLPNRPGNYGSTAAFLEHGFGSVALVEGTVASAASTYATSRRMAEIAIATRPSQRRRGLATPVAAHTVLTCLERGLEPCWSAANEASCRVAERLGFVRAGVCHVVDVGPESPWT